MDVRNDIIAKVIHDGTNTVATIVIKNDPLHINSQVVIVADGVEYQVDANELMRAVENARNC